jgi:glycogen debranching enzyme
MPAGGSRTGALPPRDPRRRYLNELVSAVSAPAMCLSGADGQVREGGAQGLYVQELRAVSQLVVTVDGTEPVPLGHEARGGGDNEFVAALVCPAAKGSDPKIFLRRRRAVHPEGMDEHFTVTSYSPPPGVACRMELNVQSDLAGVGAVNAGLVGAPRLAARAPLEQGGLAWRGPGGCQVVVSGKPAPATVDPAVGTLGWDLYLEQGAPVTVSVNVQFAPADLSSLFEAPPATPSLLGFPRVVARDQRLARFLEVSIADLGAMVLSETGEKAHAFVAAGVPWYLTLFGRDSLWAARMLLPLGTDLALGTLRVLGRRQGQRDDLRTGEEPGKILHEVRHEGPEGRPRGGTASAAGWRGGWLPPVYYGTVDATALWACLLHEAWKWGASEEEVEALLPTLEGCLGWLARGLERGGGFLTYVDKSGKGLSNQGWKDSFDAIQFRDGRFAKVPLALCEVQGYAYQAAVGGAEMLAHFGLAGSDRWASLAGDLAARFRDKFWAQDADGAFPALALEADGTPVDAPSSNMGHLLGTGILTREESEVVAVRLGLPELDCGYGLRTLSSCCRGFNPLGYHIGSVWAHDTAISVRGLALAGGPSAQATAASLVEGLLGAAEGFGYRLPELYGGHTRRPGALAPLPYPPACRPQAWAAASSVAVLAALAGVRPDVPNGRISVRPLPSDVGLDLVDGMRVGGRRLSVRLGPGGPVVEGGPPGLMADPTEPGGRGGT